MKVKSYIPFKVCRNCVYNDYKRTGVDFCVRAGCKYKISEKKEDNNVRKSQQIGT